MYVWLIIFVVPINAFVNPLLYTFTTPKYRSVLTSKNKFKISYSISGKSLTIHYLNLKAPHLLLIVNYMLILMFLMLFVASTLRFCIDP